jgi:hypothetical protein
MMKQAAGKAGPGSLLAVVGGVLAGLGSFLAWAKVSAQGLDVSAKGTDGSDGWITLVAAIVLILCGLLALQGAGRKVVAVVAVLAGLVAGGLALYDALTAKDTIIDKTAEEVAGSLGVPKADAVAMINAAIDAGQIDLSLAFGIYLVIGGGALGLIGGGLMFGGGKPSAAPTFATETAAPVASAAPAAPPMPAGEPAPSPWASAPPSDAAPGAPEASEPPDPDTSP